MCDKHTYVQRYTCIYVDIVRLITDGTSKLIIDQLSAFDLNCHIMLSMTEANHRVTTKIKVTRG